MSTSTLSQFFQLFEYALRFPSKGAWIHSIAHGDLVSDFESLWSALQLSARGLEIITEFKNDGTMRAHELNPMRSIEALSDSAELDEYFHRLRIEYTRLFVGESAVVERSEGMFLQRLHGVANPVRMINNHTYAVQEFMKRMGVARKPGYNDSIDDIENEFAFCAYLCTFGDTSSEEECTLVLEQFLEEHFLTWVPNFSEQLSLQSEVHYYQFIGSLLGEFCRELL